MARQDPPELTVRWWQDNQPKGLRAAPKLELALRAWDSARKRLDREIDEETLEQAEDRLEQVEDATHAAAAEAEKSKTIPDGAALATALRRLDRDIAAERKHLEKLADDLAAKDFATPAAFRAYLLKALKRVHGGLRMNFALALGQKPEDSRMALHRSKGGKALMGLLVRETGIHAVTWGTAAGDEKKGDVLTLAVEGKPLSGMARRGREMLKEHQPLPFKQMRLTDGEEELAETED